MQAEIDNLIYAFSKLPGLGPRSARRIVIHLMQNKIKSMRPLFEMIGVVIDKVDRCRTCNNLDVSNPCAICLDESRTSSQLCIVEDVSDLWALEKGGFFEGKFHVLGGTLSAIDGIGPEQLAIESLIHRLETGEFEEVILANNPTVEGKTTAHYITERIKHLPIRISRLAYGIPIGSEIDYLDEMTLSAAIASRQTIMSE
ncbi:MAG: recombination protein RecR [Alphaproteobacteria bacterium]|nr:recombination protein RecR [Alphaproteobacteria bacterium]OJV12185.1 MAG: recombination protein RecR [Alphaproteobacteria bacterium 33-17]